MVSTVIGIALHIGFAGIEVCLDKPIVPRVVNSVPYNTFMYRPLMEDIHTMVSTVIGIALHIGFAGIEEYRTPSGT